MRALRFLPPLLLPLLLAGCGAKSMYVRGYEGEPRPAGEVATLTVPVELEVFEVSGVEVESPSVDRGSYTLEVPAGEQRLLLQYFVNWPGGSDTDVIRSPGMSLIADFRAGGRYRLEYPVPELRDDALRYAKAPQATLVSADGRERVSARVHVNSMSLLDRAFGSFRPSREGAGPIRSAAAAEQDDAPAPTQPPVDQTALERLKYWWQQAGEAERQAFWQWIGSKLAR